MKLRKVLHLSQFERDGAGGDPDDWTNVSGTTAVHPTTATGAEHDHFVNVESTDAGTTDAVMSLTTPPTQNVKLRYIWKQWERQGDPSYHYEFKVIVFANGADFRNGSFTGYVITQTATQLILDRYNSGSLTNLTTESLAAEYGQEYWYEFVYNPSNGAWSLKRANTTPHIWDATYSGTDGSRITSGTFIAVCAARHANNTYHGFDDFRITSADEAYFRAGRYKRALNAAGQWEAMVANPDGALFEGYAIGERIELITTREDGAEWVEVLGFVDSVTDESYAGNFVRLKGSDALGELERRDPNQTYTSQNKEFVMWSILLAASEELSNQQIKATGSVTTRNLKGLNGLDALRAIVVEADYTFRLDRRDSLIIDDAPLPGSEDFNLIRDVLARSPEGFWPHQEHGVPGSYTRAVDLSPNANHGTWVNGPVTAQVGPIRRALQLVAAGSNYITLPTGIVSAMVNFTFIGWVNLATAATYSRIFDFGTGQSNYMFLTPANTWGGGVDAGVGFAIKKGAGSEEHIAGPDALPTNQWVFVAAVLSGGLGYIYVDGEEVESDTMNTNPDDLGATDQNYIGKSQFADPYLSTNGIAYFAIFDSALSAATIKALYRAGRYGVVLDQADGRIHSPRVTKDARGVANQVRVYGSASGSITGVATDATSRTAIGKRDLVIHDARLGANADARALADATLAALKDPNYNAALYATDYHELNVGERCLFSMKYGVITEQEYLVVEKSFDPERGFGFRLVPVDAQYDAPRSDGEIIGRMMRENNWRNWEVLPG